MNGSQRASLIEKVQKLLALSGGTANEHEAAAAAAKATELIQAYNLEQGELEKSGKKVSEPIGYVFVRVFTNAGKQQGVRKVWITDLAMCVCEANFCEARFGTQSIVVYGRPTDTELAAYMIQNLVFQLERMAFERGEAYAKAFFKSHGIYPRQVSGSRNIHNWKSSWLQGAVMVVREKLKAQRQKFQEESKNGLELVVTRGDELADYFKRQAAARAAARAASGLKPRKHKETFSAPGPSSFNNTAFRQGMADGANIDVQPGVGAAAQPIQQLN